MAMFKCPECKSKVSTGAGACPKCGYVLTDSDKQIAEQKALKPWYKKWWGIVLIVFIALVALGALIPSDKDSSGSAKTAPAPKVAEVPGQAEFDEGQAAFYKESYKEAFAAFEKGVALGNKDAKAFLGIMYLFGEGIKEDTKKGFALVQEAANESSPYGLVELANYYFTGSFGLKKDTQTGYSLMSKAYDTGHWYPAYALADWHLEKNSPYGVRDIDKATQYINEAEKRGLKKEVAADFREGIKNLPDYEITAAQLHREYNANEVAADQKYKGKKLKVSGTVKSIEKDIMGGIIVQINVPGNYGWNYVMCNIRKDNENKAASLRKGQKIAIQGTGGMMIMENPVVDKCWIVD